MIWIVLWLIVGLTLILGGRGIRRRRGLTEGRTLDLDGRTLRSAQLGLIGRPDRILLEDGVPVPEEWKSSLRVYDSHRAQVGVYLLLIEEETGVRPPHGYVVTGDGGRERVKNTEELRAWVLGVAEQFREARRGLPHRWRAPG